MFNPEAPSSNHEPRPIAEKIADAVDRQRMMYKKVRMQYESSKNQFMNWAGGETDEAREEYYPGWTDEDFKTLLGELKKMEKGG